MSFITQGKTNWNFILIVVILAAIVGGGIWWSTEQQKESTQLLEIEKPEQVALNYKGILSQMFPDKEFSEIKEKHFKDRENHTYYVEKVVEGYFIKPDEENILLIVRRPKDELAHVEGFYQAFLAVFDIKGKEILTETKFLGGDEGEIVFYNCQRGTFILSIGIKLGQGWMQPRTNLFQVKNGKFEKIWPNKDWDDDNTIVEPQEDRIAIYKREGIQPDFVCPTKCLNVMIFQPESMMPSYAFIYSHDLYWNSNTCKYEYRKAY